MLSPSAALPVAKLRILAPEEADERARNREAWADLWRAIVREANAEPDDGDPDSNDDRPGAKAAAGGEPGCRRFQGGCLCTP